jgi:hypothetical protein
LTQDVYAEVNGQYIREARNVSTLWSDTKTDITVERARAELSNAHAHQARVEETIESGGFCCEHHEKFQLSSAKKEVKRWSQWLADHDVLEKGSQANLPGF